MNDDLLRLLKAWQTEDILDEEVDELLELLRNDPDLRREFVHEIVMSGQLRAVQSSQPRWLELEALLVGSALDLPNASGLENSVMAILGDVRGDDTAITATHHSTSRSRQIPFLVGALAACLLLAVLVVQLVYRGNASHEEVPVANSDSLSESIEISSTLPSDEVAIVSAVFPDAESSDLSTEFKDNAIVKRGWHKLSTGMVQFDFFSGVRMIVRAPAEFQIRSPYEVHFERGECTCTVSELGRGFKVVSPRMEVIDLGTVFSFSTDPQGEDQVHVVRGKVELKTAKQSNFTEVLQSEAIQSVGDTLKQIPFQPNLFPQSSEVAKLRAIRNQHRYDAWKKQSERLRKDSDTVVYYTFEEIDPSDSEVLNVATSTAKGTNGVLFGGRTVPGRWPMKQALKFENQFDRVLFRLDGLHDSLTLATFVRINSLVNPNSAILMSESFQRWSNMGSMTEEEKVLAQDRLNSHGNKTARWVIGQQGHPKLYLEFLEKNGATNWDRYVCPNKSVAGEARGQWVMLAVTYDLESNSVTHYVNGVETAKHDLTQGRPISLEFCELGNLVVGPAERAKGIDFLFYGEMDEFLISKRALSASEIKELWDIGKP